MIKEYYDNLLDKEEVRVVAFGDINSGNYTMTTQGESYGEYLEPKLIKLLQTRVTVLNSGIMELTFRKSLQYIDIEILSFNPDVVLVMLGSNDVLYQNMSQFEFRNRVDDLFDILKEQNLNVIVIMPPAYKNVRSIHDYEYRRMLQYYELLFFSAGIHGFPVLDFTSHLEKLWKKDKGAYRSMFVGNHILSEDGKKYLADFIYDTMVKIIEKHED